jgi:hypothetical protein
MCDACLQCSSSIKPNCHCSHPIKKYSIAPHGDIRYSILSRLFAISIFLCLTAVIDFSSISTAIFYLALQPCLTAIKAMPHGDILFGLLVTPHSNIYSAL